MIYTLSVRRPKYQPIDRKMRRRSVAVLCVLFRIKSNPVHPLSDALPLQYVPARVTRGALVALVLNHPSLHASRFGR